MFMDPEARARRQSRRVIISEIIMVCSVVLMVIILAFLVSGYWVNSDFKVERQGMLQISSYPTGANVEVDGDAPWFQRTNTSKVLSSGEHTIKLTKDGYDTWSRTINIREGLLYRIHYPRLFLTDRTKSSVYDLSGATFATVSPAHDKMLIVSPSATWQLVNLEGDQLTSKPIDVTGVLSSASGQAFTGTILSASWDSNNEHILLKVQAGGQIEWILLNVNNPTTSLNLTRQFTTDFSEVKIFDNSASVLLAVRGGNLHKIDVSSRQISAILVKNVHSYDYLGSEIVYSALRAVDNILDVADDANTTVATDDATTEESTTAVYEIGILKISNAEPKIVTTATNPTKVVISRFYDDKYLTLLSENNVTVYEADNFSEFLNRNISFAPQTIKTGRDGGFIFMTNGTAIASLDMEAEDISEWTIDSPNFGWLDSGMLYAIKDGTLVVYDFDGLNRRTLANNVSSKFPVAITDNKWLYYVDDGALIREIIAQ